MALLEKIKRKLGFGSEASDQGVGETTVTVEQEADGSVADGRPAGVEAGDAASTAPDDGVASGAEEAAGAEETTGAEVGAVDESEDAADSGDAPSAAADDTTADDTAADAAEPRSDGDPVDQIKGIGPAYGERLAEMGIETVDELAAADPVDVAEGASVGEKRASRWIDRAERF
jgi:predicted flap endonuclease-1-like 5' DNA nuclease